MTPKDDPKTLMFYVVSCSRCGEWSVVGDLKMNADRTEGYCPRCNDMMIAWRRFDSNDIEAIDDEALYNIWEAVSLYMQDAAREDSLSDEEREVFGKTAEDVVQALSEAPGKFPKPFRSRRPVRAYTFAVLFGHGEWITTDPMNSRSEAEAKRLVEKALASSSDPGRFAVSGIYLTHVGEVEEDLDVDEEAPTNVVATTSRNDEPTVPGRSDP